HTVTSISTSLTVSPASGTYGGNTNAALTATLASGGSGLTIYFYLNGALAGSALTDGSGVATLSSPSSLTGINAGSYGSGGAPSSCTGVQGVCAAFGGDPSHTASSASNTLTVNQVPVTITASSPSVSYGDPVPTITAGFSAFKGADTSAVLTTQPTCTTAYLTTSNAGSTPIGRASGTERANYSFGYTP